MYSLTLLQRQLESLEKSSQQLSYYSIPSSLEWQQHLDSLYDYEKKKLTRDLTREEQGFITNELTLSKLHAPYWLERYAKIKTSSGRVQLFAPNFTQQVILSIIAEMEEQQIPIMMQFLKLRQLGVSTIWELLIAHRVLLYPNTDALVASNDPDKTMKLLEQYAGLCYRNLPWWMCREVEDGGDLLIKRSGEVYAEFLGHNSAISWQHGTQTSGMARGGNPQIAHLTEPDDYANPKELIEGSLMNAVHEDSLTLFGVEGTAGGRDTWWHKFWKANEKYWGQGIARFRPLFLPWFLGKDVWPPKGWVEDRTNRGVLANYRPSELTIAHAERARAYVKSKPHLSKVLGANWTMPIEQLAYWEFSREFAIEMDSVKQWLQEVGAADADECFQSGGTQIFPYELISQYRNRLGTPTGIYYVDSEHITERLKVYRDKDKNRDVAEIAVEIAGPQTTFTARLIPLDSSLYPELDPQGKVFVYEPPQKGYIYSIAYDAAGGRKGDNVSVQVIRHATHHSKARQVCEWGANTFTYHDAWPILLTIARYYSTYAEDRQSMIVIELQNNGNEVQDELHRRGWTNFYKRYNINGKEKKFEGLGWNTTRGSRPKLTDTLIKAVKDQWFEINSPWLLREIEDLETNETLQSIRVEAKAGSRDDRAICTGMLLAATHSEIAPHSQNSVVQRLLKNLQERTRTQAITPNMLETSLRERKESLIYFGSSPTLAPTDEGFMDGTKRSNLWN